MNRREVIRAWFGRMRAKAQLYAAMMDTVHGVYGPHVQNHVAKTMTDNFMAHQISKERLRGN